METRTNITPLISILFVEDDEEILALQATIIAARFPDIILYTAGNGRLGLELFKAHTPEIVITDINMAEMCGVQMADQIHAIRPETKLIAITGKTYDSNENGKFILHHSNGKAVEFHHFIVKPVNLSKLFTVIEQCLAEIE